MSLDPLPTHNSIPPTPLTPTKLRLVGILEGAPRIGPSSVHIDVANRCNTNCVTCWDHSPLLDAPRPQSWKRQLMAFDDYARILTQVRETGGLTHHILSGMGEPLTNPAIYDMIRFAKGLGLHVTMITNLLMADPDRLLETGIDDLLISINGISPKSYTAFHPDKEPADFDRLLRILERLAQAGKHYKHVQVINRDTADEVEGMVDFAHRFGAHQLNYKLASLRHGTEACAITEDQRQRLLHQHIPRAMARATALGLSTNLEVFRTQVESGGLTTAPIEPIGCFMGYTYARVTVDQTVLFCCSTEVVVGNLATGQHFGEIWSGPRWNEVRQQLAQGRYFPNCTQCGKFNQNVKLSQKIAAKFGTSLRDRLIGRGDKAALVARDDDERGIDV